MRFDIYGRYELEIIRKDDRWVIYRTDAGKRRSEGDLVIPASFGADEIATYLDDMLHEWAKPGRVIRRLD